MHIRKSSIKLSEMSISCMTSATSTLNTLSKMGSYTIHSVSVCKSVCAKKMQTSLVPLVRFYFTKYRSIFYFIVSSVCLAHSIFNFYIFSHTLPFRRVFFRKECFSSFVFVFYARSSSYPSTSNTIKISALDCPK